MKPALVISGGQTGADQAGLRAAARRGIPTGGFAPKGWRTENGPAPWLQNSYRLVEAPSEDYKWRTAANVLKSDAVLVFGRSSPGSALTLRLAAKHKKPWMHLPVPDPDATLTWADVEAFCKITGGVWMIAGNRESVSPGIESSVEDWLYEVWA